MRERAFSSRPTTGTRSAAMPSPKRGMLAWIDSYCPGATEYVSCQIPTDPFPPMLRLNSAHAGRCFASRACAYVCKCSKLRQYWITPTPRQYMKNSACSSPSAGCRFTSAIIGGIALATRIQLRRANSRFTRMPMRNTTNGSSLCAAYRPGNTCAIELLLYAVVSVPVLIEKLLRLQRRHAHRPRCRNRLPVAPVLYVSARIHARNHLPVVRRQHVAQCLDVAVLIQVHLSDQHLCIRHVPNAQKQPLDRQLIRHARLHILELEPLHILLFHAQHLFHHRVGAQFDIRMRDRAVKHDLRSAELFAPVQQRDLAGKAGQEQRFFHCRVPSAHDCNILVTEEGSIARSAA